MGAGPHLALTAILPLLWSGLSAMAAGLNSLHEFRIGECSIRMRITFPPPYEGSRLEVYRSPNPRKALCVAPEAGSRECVRRFVGAIAVVEFAVTRLADGKPAGGSIREVATLVDQSPGMPPRPPFEMSVTLVKGFGSDLQAFGYDEEPLPPSERAAEREMAKRTWRRYRQELFFNTDRHPFAVVEWMHTTAGIRVLGVEQAPRPGSASTSRGNPQAP